ncbi:glutathione S-transferase omega-1-like isoform X1 [Gracilinanus agilis]|uniref:glutathione S-transferase omega-1-like isoform X1 n=1 Tax=Gracilinanus agilis TaxID=191870 RepID=UPI001CFCF566|nr:glutathione S-transferase omega-1-like isoform X1 [Gracilinanus agilis]
MSGESPRSLGKGSPQPGPVPLGVIRLYSMRFCPFAQRTRLVLKAKGIKHEVVNINLKNKPEWFFKKHPLGLIPVLENSKGQLIHDSSITCEYLDDVYPGKKLFPEDPYEKALQKMNLELLSKIPGLAKDVITAVQNNEHGTPKKEELCNEFNKLEEVLNRQRTTFLGGNSVSMIDYLIWPWFERLELYEIPNCLDQTPALKLWVVAMRNDPIVAALLTDVKTFKGFYDLYFQNNPDAFDYGL